MAQLERKIKFEFQGREYELEFPTVGQFMEIEEQKIIISNGQYGNLLNSRTIAALRVVQMTEAISILQVLCPSLFKDMKVTDYREIDAKDFAQLLKVYQKQIQPWYSGWFKEFNDIFIEVNEDARALNKEEEEAGK